MADELSGWAQAGLGAGGQLLGMLGGHQAGRRNYRDQRNLMDLQHRNQRDLNQQGHDLQFDMWNKTNYGAQVGHMKDAGLNPALMYKGAGPGGTTGSQGGGSASGGASQMTKAMDMQNMLVGAQINSLNAKANKDNADAGLVPTTEKGILANIKTEEAKQEFMGVQTKYTALLGNADISKKGAEVKRLIEETKNIGIRNEVDKATIGAEINRMIAESLGAVLENKFKEANISLTESKIKEISESITQRWKDLELKGREVDVKEFEAGLKADYPSVQQMLGKGIQGAYDITKWMESVMPEWLGGGEWRLDEIDWRNQYKNIKNKIGIK